MPDLSDLGKQQREELVEAISETISGRHGRLVPQYAEAVVKMLEKRGLLHFQSKNCPSCGRDRLEAEHGVCAMGGCPCGGDF